MPKSANAKPLSKIRPYIWPAVAVASVLLNVGLVGGYYYLVHFDQFPLMRAEIPARCSDPGYSRLMHAIADNVRASGAGDQGVADNLKFAAASLCFYDYQTGKPLELDALKPNPDSDAVVKPKA